MEIDKLTIGKVKEINGVFADYIGKYVIVRSRNEGVNAGRVRRAGIGFVELADARRLWYHKPKKKAASWYEGVSIYGLSDDSKISNTVDLKLIVEDYSITNCSEEAESSIRVHPASEQ